MHGVQLRLLHPEIPPCEDCQAHLYDPETWKPSRRAGKPVPRPRGAPTPCHRCPKAQDNRPAPWKELTPEGMQAYLYYLRCKEDATGVLPRDLIVVTNNALCRMVEDGVARHQASLLPLMLLGARK